MPLSMEAIPRNATRGSNYGLIDRKRFSGRYGVVDVMESLEKLSHHPLEHWTQAYLRFTAFEGGKRIREALSTILSTVGVVA